jgi:predicted P-loop ATPase
VLYRLPEVLAAQRVFIVEGEKDVETLRALGYVATTAAMGAKTQWAKEYAAMWQEPLKNKDVVLLPDNDEPGRKHMHQAQKHLTGHAQSVRYLELPNLPEKGDVSDWFKAGHTPEELEALLAAPPTGPAVKPPAVERKPKKRSAQAEKNLKYQEPDYIPDVSDPDAWRAGLLTNENGIPRDCLHNIALCMAHLPELETIWWDSFAWTPMWGDRMVEDKDFITIAGLLGYTFQLPVNSTASIAKCLHALARQRERDPLKEYVQGLEWDGVKRLETWMHDYLGADDTALDEWIGKVLCCAMVSRALFPGCQQRYVVIFEGPENTGKSKACGILGAPWADAMTTGFDGKEAVLTIRGCWVMEIEELNAMRRSEEAAVKAFVTRREDRVILKYANEATVYPRRTILIGTVNPGADGYLRGATGHDDTRYLPVKVTAVDTKGLQKARDQLLAEAKYLIGEGFAWWETPDLADKQLISERESRRETNVFHEIIQKWLIRPQTVDDMNDHAGYVTLAEVMTKALGIEEKERLGNKSTQMQVAAVLRACGWTRKVIRDGEITVRAWVKPGAEQDVPF